MDLKKKLRGIFSLSTAAAAVVQNSASAHSSMLQSPGAQEIDSPQSLQPGPEKLIFRPADQIEKLYVGHSSHASHASHASHYSGSGNSYDSSGSTYTTPAPNNNYSTPIIPATPPATYTQPAQPVAHKDDPDYAARLLAAKIEWADEGLPSYQYEVGMMYLTGNGLEKDESKGKDYIGRAAHQGFSDAVAKMKALNSVSTPEVQTVQQDSGASNNIVPIENPTTNEVQRAVAPDAVQLLATKAANGSASAQYELGLRYVKGLGVAKNLEKGRFYLEMAAAQGDADATNLLQTIRPTGN